MHPIIPVAAGVGALVLLRHEAGAPSRTFGQSPTEGARAALGAVPANVAGVPVVKAANGSALDTLRDHRRALVKRYGSDGFAEPYPAKMTLAQLRAVVDAWTSAFEAGRDASADTQTDFALTRRTAGAAQDVLDTVLWDEVKAGGDPFTRLGMKPTDLGRYAVKLYQWRKVQLDPLTATGDTDWSGVSASWPATTAVIRETFDRLTWFVGGIEGVTFVFPWARPSDQDPTKHVGGALGAAASASAAAVGNGASKVVGLAVNVLTDIITTPAAVLVGLAVVGTAFYFVAVRK